MSFIAKKENKIINKFNKQGFIIFNIKEKKTLFKIKKQIVILTKKFLKKNSINNGSKDIFNYTHKFIDPKILNKFRMFVYSELNKLPWFLKSYYSLGRNYLDSICGNELVMQRSVNLSIQLPKDDSSLLPLHSDVWSGCSPYEVVLWIPLVNCKKTKTMFILPKNDNEKYYKKMHKFSLVNEIEKNIEKKIKWLNIKFGQGIIFQHSMMHGNKINQEATSRWSFNCRFKSVFSPYDDKSIGETFIPITLRPASIFGMNYTTPKVKNVRF